MRYTQDMFDEIRTRRELGQTWDSIAEDMSLASGKAHVKCTQITSMAEGN